MIDQLIRGIHQLDMTYRPFYSEQHIDLCSLNNVSVLPNNTAYSVKSIGNGSDVTDHIAKVLEITEWIKIPNVDKDELRLHIFSKSLSGDAEKWWNNEGTATTWKELGDNFFHKYYPLSHACNNQLIGRIHQLDTTYRPFYSEQRIDLCSLNNVSVLPNNTAYSVKSIQPADIQQIHTAYSLVIASYNSGIMSNDDDRDHTNSPMITKPDMKIGDIARQLLQHILDSKGAIPTKTVADAKVAIQEMAEYSQKWHNRTSSKARRASVSVMPFSTYSNLGLGDLAHTRLTIELADRTIKHPRGIAENVLVRIGFSITNDIDITSDVVLGMPFCKKFLSCQKIMERFTHGDKCERMDE
ncbi:hypothetical protein Tco_0896601 [Tanacetum coccineum]